LRTVARITGSYDRSEDRIRLAVLDDREQPLALWLTQWLANRLVREVLGLFGRQAEQMTPAPIPAGQRSAVQFLQQTSAELRMQKVSPVQTPPDTVLGLVTAIRIRRRQTRFILEFHCGAGECGEDEGVALPLDATELRQFMRIVHRLYGRAEWPTAGIWPDWFDEGAHKKLLAPSQIN